MTQSLLFGAFLAALFYVLIPGPAFLQLLGIGAGQGRKAGAFFMRFSFHFKKGGAVSWVPVPPWDRERRDHPAVRQRKVLPRSVRAPYRLRPVRRVSVLPMSVLVLVLVPVLVWGAQPRQSSRRVPAQ